METIRVWKLNHANFQIECESGAAQELNEHFSFYVPGYKFMPAYRNRMWDGKIRLFTLRDRTLPAGLFYHLSEFCEKRGYILESVNSKYGAPDGRTVVTPANLDLFVSRLDSVYSLRDYQYQCVGEALVRKRGILLSPTGSGKSFIIYNIIRYWLSMPH